MEVWLIPCETINPWFYKAVLNRNKKLYISKLNVYGRFVLKINGIINLALYQVMWQIFSLKYQFDHFFSPTFFPNVSFSSALKNTYFMPTLILYTWNVIDSKNSSALDMKLSSQL